MFQNQLKVQNTFKYLNFITLLLYSCPLTNEVKKNERVTNTWPLPAATAAKQKWRGPGRYETSCKAWCSMKPTHRDVSDIRVYVDKNVRFRISFYFVYFDGGHISSDLSTSHADGFTFFGKSTVKSH